MRKVQKGSGRVWVTLSPWSDPAERCDVWGVEVDWHEEDEGWGPDELFDEALAEGLCRAGLERVLGSLASLKNERQCLEIDLHTGKRTLWEAPPPKEEK